MTDLTSLDFADIKNDLKTFLRSQDEFTDYDFDGSGLNILLDVLAYNAQYMAYQTNMLVGESFIDSAQVRSSVVSHAKTLGYTPRSVIAPVALIDLQINSPSGSPDTILVPKGTKFSSTIDGKIYSFVTKDTYTAYKSNSYLISDVYLYEGVWKQKTYTVTDPLVSFDIPSKEADTTTLSVVVQNSVTDINQTLFTINTSFDTLNSITNSFFLEENLDGYYSVIFGDGNLGKKLSIGNVVILDYIVSNADEANGCSVFTLTDSISGYTNVTITTVSKAFGGSVKESIESIRYTAPRNFQTQNRAVTVNDFRTIVQEKFPNIKSIQVWGGEDNDPPVYGKVFLAIQPSENQIISESEKDYIINVLLKPYKIVTVSVDIIDPTYTYINVVSKIKYNPLVTSNTSNQISDNIKEDLVNYAEVNINKFNTNCRYSKLITLIDNADPSIKSNITSVTLTNKITPTLSTKTQYITTFNNEVVKGSLVSTGFKFLESSTPTLVSYIDDDSLGNVRAFHYVLEEKVYETLPIGTIDYTTGKIILNDTTITLLNDGTTLDFYVTPKEFDIVSKRNQILLLESDNITITMLSDYT